MNDTSQIYEAMFLEDSKTETSKDNLDVMPAIMSQVGLTPRFEKFYDKLKHGLFINNAACLYNISEHALAYDDFTEMYENVLGKSLNKILSLDSRKRGMALMLNPDAEKRIPGVLESVTLHTYHLDAGYVDEMNLIHNRQTSLVVQSTDMYFTYKSGEFCLVSNFTPLVTR